MSEKKQPTDEARTFARLVCEAVGLDPNRVSHLELILDARDIPRLRVDMLAFDVQPAAKAVTEYLGAKLSERTLPLVLEINAESMEEAD